MVHIVNIRSTDRKGSVMEFCIVHGREHYEGETDSVRTLGDDLECRTEQWPVVEGEVLTSQCEALNEAEAFFTVAAGNLAYLNTVEAGIVPVKVVGIDGWQADVKVTAGRPGWKRGETVTLNVPTLSLVARRQVRTSKGSVLINGQTRFEEGLL